MHAWAFLCLGLGRGVEALHKFVFHVCADARKCVQALNHGIHRRFAAFGMTCERANCTSENDFIYEIECAYMRDSMGGLRVLLRTCKGIKK